MPIVPLVIAGARQTQPKGQYLINIGRWKRRVILKALSPVHAKDYSEDQITELQEAVHAKMAKAYSELKQELAIVPGSPEYKS